MLVAIRATGKKKGGRGGKKPQKCMATNWAPWSKEEQSMSCVLPHFSNGALCAIIHLCAPSVNIIYHLQIGGENERNYKSVQVNIQQFY